MKSSSNLIIQVKLIGWMAERESTCKVAGIFQACLMVDAPER